MKKEMILCAAGMLAVACSSETPVAELQAMSLTMTRANGETNANVGAGDTPILLFWKEADLSGVGTTAQTPYSTFVPNAGISAYENIPCNIQTDYPADNTDIYAYGISPSTMTTQTSPLSTESYTRYTLPSGKEGLTDVMASAVLSGSRKWPFGQPMVFRHLTTRVTFKAQRTENTRDKMYIKNLKLTIPKEWACKGVVWKTDTHQYTSDAATADITAATADQLRIEESAVIGTFYLLLSAPSDFTGLTITADLAKDVNFTVDKRSASFAVTTENIDFKDNMGNTVTAFNPGESYETTLLFDIDSFTLEGEQEDWENGGKLTIPVIMPS